MQWAEWRDAGDVGAQVYRGEGRPPPLDDIEARMRSEGLSPRQWGNPPGDRYEWHEHPYHKVLYCVSGSIVFHTRTDGDLRLQAGDRLEIEPGTAHAATVGSEGVECVEAPR